MSAPTIASETIASLTVSSALLGATVTGTGITETGIAYSVTSVNPAPVKGGSGVLTSILSPVAASGGLFTRTISGLLPATTYTFNAYSIGSGTSTANATTFTTLPLPAFGTSASTTPNGDTVYIRLRNGRKDVLTSVTSVTAILQPYATGTYRDVFDAIQTLNTTGYYGATAFATTSLLNTSSGVPAATTPTTASDEVLHVPPRQGQWMESGVLFTTASGLQYRYFDKDIYGWSNAQLSDAPTNVTF